MRLWSLHPGYLDVKGLSGLWREGIMARNALLGRKKGYINHPQLERFKKQKDPILFIDTYLLNVYEESLRRNFNFSREKFGSNFTPSKIEVTEGQLAYELKHLKRKLKVRDIDKYEELKKIEFLEVNSIFKVVKGDIEPWERPY
ncbi:MAG: pyrimidine dimer DNA glycosylase/endonuclease V [Methanobacterium sp.]